MTEASSETTTARRMIFAHHPKDAPTNETREAAILATLTASGLTLDDVSIEDKASRIVPRGNVYALLEPEPAFDRFGYQMPSDFGEGL